MRLQPDDASTVQETLTDRSSRRWKNALVGMSSYARWYPKYDFKFEIFVFETRKLAGTGRVATL